MTAQLAVAPFKNKENYAKYLLMHYEPGANVLLTVFDWLYKGPTPPEQFLVEYAKNKTYGMNKDEKDKLEKLKNGEIALNQLDFSLLYSLVKLSCDVARRDDPVWGRNCPLHRTNELEHLLYLLKQGRNKLAHPSEAQKNLSDSDVLNHAQEMITLLSSILTLAGERALVDDIEINKVIESVKESIDKICQDTDPVKEIDLKPQLKEMYSQHFGKAKDNIADWIENMKIDAQNEIESKGKDIIEKILENKQGEHTQQDIDNSVKVLTHIVDHSAQVLGAFVQEKEKVINDFFNNDTRDIPTVLKEEFTAEKASRGISNVFKNLF